MDLEQRLAVPSPVDEEAVGAELMGYVDGASVDREPWRIENLGQADWAMRKLAEAQQIERHYRDQIALWDDARKRATRAVDWLDERLAEWAVAQRTKDRKSFPLAHGSVATRESKPKIVVEDENAVIEWARTHAPDAIVQPAEEFRISKLGDAAVIGEVVVAFESTHKTTGEVDRIENVKPKVRAKVNVDALTARLGDEYVLDLVLAPAVVDVDGEIVPGLGITPGRVTATVTPLIL